MGAECSSCVKVATDYFLVYSCRKKAIDDADINAVKHFMGADARFAYLLGLLTVNPSAYVDLLDTYYKAKCVYPEGMKQLDGPAFLSE